MLILKSYIILYYKSILLPLENQDVHTELHRSIPSLLGTIITEVNKDELE